MLERMSALDGALHSYITVTADLGLGTGQSRRTRNPKRNVSRAAARIPIAVKDLCYTKGIPTTAASPLYADFKPDFNATVVDKFYAAEPLCWANWR